MKESITKKDIKKNNCSRVFHFLIHHPGSTKKTLMQALNMSMPTLVRNINELTEMNLVVMSGQDDSCGGRRPETFSVNAGAKVAIGIDVTRRHVAIIAIDLGVNILAHRRDYLLFENTDEYFSKVGEFANDFIAQLGCKDEDILGIGISVPGILSKDRSRLLYGDVINFNGESMDKFAQVLNFPCWYSNDSTAAGFAEFLRIPHLKDAIYLYLSNSVGGSIMIDGKLVEGNHNKSAEFGHVCIENGGRKCYCGLDGCFNAYCNATLLASAAGGSVEDFFCKLNHGDAHCWSVWTEYKKHLVHMIRMLRTIFDTDIIIGGYVGSCMGDHFEEIKTALNENQLFENGATYVYPCNYQVEAAALGVALHFIQDYLDAV